jgi:hypothetical protein
MMRDRNILRRRGVAIAALTIALCVGVPEFVGPAGATSAPTNPSATGQTELVARVATRPAAAARSTQTSAIQKQRARRRAARAKRQRQRRLANRKSRAKRAKKQTKRQRAANKRRNALAAKRAANRRKRNHGATKNANSKSMGLVDWAEVLFFVLLPFLAVAAFLGFTDYQRKPRAPSRHGRKRSLVITPVSRKF